MFSLPSGVSSASELKLELCVNAELYYELLVMLSSPQFDWYFGSFIWLLIDRITINILQSLSGVWTNLTCYIFRDFADCGILTFQLHTLSLVPLWGFWLLIIFLPLLFQECWNNRLMKFLSFCVSETLEILPATMYLNVWFYGTACILRKWANLFTSSHLLCLRFLSCDNSQYLCSSFRS